MEFIVRAPLNRPDTLEVRYDCACGCKPRARYDRGTQEANYEHCCCGQVHFVGHQAEERLRDYLQARRAEGLDTDQVHTIETHEVTAPWGDPVPVALAVPDPSRVH
jgi:hypothetical protein